MIESSVEPYDIKDPFKEVSMFKRNYDHLPKDTYFGMYKESTRGNPNYFLTYGNEKSIARVQHHLRPNGAHKWPNYMKTPKYRGYVVIIEGLKESGVFTSIIAKAPTTLSRDKFLASIESSNSSRESRAHSHPPRKIRRIPEHHSQATVRKALEAVEFHELAVPPLSPPGPTIETSENNVVVEAR
ncbi:hypothetical protein L2E82_30133 [Cichorium intybus]|uniref:Uncharacterized protein n=1 Tax=Cichorium intybus TaxID=13427 RepID=A0ACB9D068_CICIN|nr:hypothetical protein L2E82_30133 [Cichorium intybus]